MIRKIVDSVYRAYSLVRRIPYVGDRVAYSPLKYDHHPVWDIHRRFLQYRTAIPQKGKIIHVINRLPDFYASKGYEYVSELENIFSLLDRSVLQSTDYNHIIEELKKKMADPKLKSVVFQSSGAAELNLPWIQEFLNKQVLIPIVPAVIEERTNFDGFAKKGEVSFLMFASRYHEKGLHIFSEVAKRLEKEKPHMKFTLIFGKPNEYKFPSNVHIQIIPRPKQRDRRRLYTSHDYVLNLSLGDSLGVFLDSLHFGTPMVGYPGQHGSTYCPENASFLIPNPIFIYGEGFLKDYNPFEFEAYLERLEGEGFFEEAKEALYQHMYTLDNEEVYIEKTKALSKFAKCDEMSASRWNTRIREFYETL